MRNLPRRSTGRRSARALRAARTFAVPGSSPIAFRRHALVEALMAVALVLSLSVTPVVNAHAAGEEPVSRAGAQELTVSAQAEPLAVTLDAPTATLGPEGFAATASTNLDWAKLVLLYGGWPVTDENVNAISRWMRQENGVDNWWNRNNPLNNGFGSGGGSGLGSYADLDVAAQKAAENLHRGSGYVGIVAALADGTSADATAAAIWASPWATSHYANGAHWSTAPVKAVAAPADAW